MAAESLYRDANSLLYADNKPTEEAIDRVIGKLNAEYVNLGSFLRHRVTEVYLVSYSIDKKKKFSRKRNNDDDGDITYINERNKVFNKKVRVMVILGFERGLRVVVADTDVSPLQIARYYDKYTTEIRASFERGTAL